MIKNEMQTLIARHLPSFHELADIVNAKPVFWENTKLLPYAKAMQTCPVNYEDSAEASARLDRFKPLIAKLFPETIPQDGLIESPLKEIPGMMNALQKRSSCKIPGRLFLKMDSHLPVSGSIKARGGIYEVLKHAETLAVEHNLLHFSDDYATLAEPAMREFFNKFSIAVGSTGNLGLSIGIMGAALGFNVTVHMSAEAKIWKKDLLRSKGVSVVEYQEDYSKAVEHGRSEAMKTPNCHFVDDENSKDLFMGYSVAGARIKKQFERAGIKINHETPLYAYLPCGVGGGPGGVSFGLKLAFGDAAHCYFAEPVEAPAILLGLGTGLDENISANDIGLSGKTEADGLAVSRPSGFVCRTMRHLLNGAFTADDSELFRLLAILAREEGILLEPSALAGMPGPELVYTRNRQLSENSIHLVWATGGSMVPPAEWLAYEEKGKRFL